MTTSQSVTVVTVLISLYDRVEKVERHSEQVGVVYDKVVERIITIPNTVQYGFHIPWSSQQVRMAVMESTALLLDRLTNTVRHGDTYHACSRYRPVIGAWSGRNVKLETVITDINHYPSLEKALQHCKRLVSGNSVQLYIDGNFDKPFTPEIRTT